MLIEATPFRYLFIFLKTEFRKLIVINIVAAI